MGDRDAKHLVSNATGHQYAVKPRCARGYLLRQCRTHQHIAQVGHQAHCYHLYVCSLYRHQRVCAIFASRSTCEETAQESHWCRQSCSRSNDAKRERHGKIAHRNGYAVAQAVDDMLPIASPQFISFQYVEIESHRFTLLAEVPLVLHPAGATAEPCQTCRAV